MTYFNTIEDLNKLLIKSQYCGETVRNENWHCDAWRITITNPINNIEITTDFFTGLGHRSKPKHRFDTGRPVSPKIADVLNSLVLDSAAMQLSLPDWCDEFGYSLDSVSARAIYDDCCKTGHKLRRMFSSAELLRLQELFYNH